MKELDSLKESANQLNLINAKNKTSLTIKALLKEIQVALEANISKKDIWRALVEESILGNNSYTSFLRILNPMLEEQKVLVKADKPEPKPSPEPVKAEASQKTETEKKPHEPIWPKDETPSFIYNPIPRSDILD